MTKHKKPQVKPTGPQPLDLLEFIRQNGGNEAIAKLMIEKIYTFSPSPFHFPKNPYVSNRYSKDQGMRSVLLNILTEFSLSDALTPTRSPFPFTNLFGYDLKTIDNAQKAYFFSHAGTFMLIPSGACSYRASFSALCFAKIFRNTNLKVCLQSCQNKDQFVVMIGNKEKGWFIYDPLTNPDIIFTYDHYIKEVLPTYPNATQKITSLKLTITENLAENFAHRWPAIKKEFIERLQRVDTDTLLADPTTKMALTLKNIKPNKHKPIISEAIQTAREILSQEEELNQLSEAVLFFSPADKDREQEDLTMKAQTLK